MRFIRMKLILLLTVAIIPYLSFSQVKDLNQFKQTDLSNFRTDTIQNVVYYYKDTYATGFKNEVLLGSDSYTPEGVISGYSRIDTLTGIHYSLTYYENGNPKSFNYELQPLFSQTIYYWENGKVGLITHFKDLTIKHGWFIEYNEQGVLTSKELYADDELIYSEPIE